jgi:O-methyltransferase
MNSAALAQITAKLKEELARRPPSARAGIVGRTPAALDLVGAFTSMGSQHQLLGVYADGGTATPESPRTEPRPLSRLAQDVPDLVLIASDADKESLLMDALPFLTAQTKVLIGGFQHFGFRDELFKRETSNAFAPSFANGYPNSLIHIYQCLKNAARMNLEGVVAEFGMFKGGTTMLMSRFIEALGCNWKIFGFDTFDGFPAPRSPLDMYAHPDCIYLDLATVQRFFEGRNVEIVPGDLVETAEVLAGEDIILAFVDTDNYTSAGCVLDVITDRVVVGGVIVFDHFTGRDRFLYTLGERLAAKRLLDDARYFNLHDTGVFLRLR